MVLPYDNMDYGVDEVGARNISELQDVELTNLANGEILQYNSSSEKWENQPASAGTLDGLTDTNLTSLQNEQYLRYNSSSSNWENFTLTITDTDNLVDLTDTNISSVANTEVLKYNSTSSNWENASVLINEIGDINITSLQNGEVLKYNSSSGKWENQDNTDTLNELSDVTLTGSSNNQVLKYNGSIWVNNYVNLTELADTNISTLNNGDILRYNNVSQRWETDTFNIDDLDNVNITGVANNEVLKYNSTSGKWENSNRIDTLDELGDVTLTSVTTGDLLRYNGSIFVNTKIALDNDFTNVNFTSLTNGDLIKYDGSNFINFSPTYLDGAGISDNFLIKVVSGATTQTTFKETSVASTSTSLQTFIPSGIISVLAGSIETEFFDTTKTRMHLTSNGINNAGGITITSDGRVGIHIVEPEEDLEIDGSIQIDSANVSRLKFQKSGPSPHAEGEIDAETDGTNGGVLEFYTKVDGGSVTEKLRINNQGAIGIGGANYGTSGQVIVSNGSGSAVSWSDQTDTTYSAGTGLNLVGTTFNNTAPDQTVSLTGSGATSITGTYPNFTISSTDTNTTYSAGTGVSLVGTTFSIGQSVGTSDNVTFNQVAVSQIVTNNGNTDNGYVPLKLEQTSSNAIGNSNDYNIQLYKTSHGGSTVLGKLLLGDGGFLHGSSNHSGPPILNLRDGRAGNVYYTGYVAPTVYNASRFYPSVTNGPSDNRLKHNEEIIKNGLHIIRQLVPQKYQKTNEMKDENYTGDLEDGTWKWEAGLIAQDVEKIEGLEYLVGQGGFPTQEDLDNGAVNKEYPKTLVYDDIFVYNIAATKELDEIVQKLQAENALMKNALNQLLSDAGKATIP